MGPEGYSGREPSEAARRLAARAGVRRAARGTELKGADPADAILLLSGIVETAEAAEPFDRAVAPGGARLRARGDVVYAVLPASALAAEGLRTPEDVQPVAAILIQVLQHRDLLARAAEVFGPLDETALAELERDSTWVPVRRGELLMRQGDAGDSIFVLLTGRLQALAENTDGSRTPLGEIAPGETVGEMAFFTGEPRTATVCALRDSVLLELPRPAIERLISTRPDTMRHVMRVQIERVRRANRPQPSVARMTNVAIVPLDAEVPGADFCRRLETALARFGDVVHLEPQVVDARLHAPGIAGTANGSPQEPRLVAWLNEQERTARFVIYYAVHGETAWLARAIRQADCVLLVGRAAASPEVTPFEARAAAEEDPDAPVRRVLALLHDREDVLPHGTAAWLRARPVAQHHHVRWTRDDDIDRLARFLAGRAIGIVLGGGGARGFAHIGILKALADAGIPTDLVGGTSMGAAMAAQHAMGWTPEKIEETNDRVWNRIRPHREYTLPLLSVVRGVSAYKCGVMMYTTETRIEDLWVPYFCVSSDLTEASMHVHRTGPLLEAVTASSSLPGFIVPTLLEDHMLCDGALFNNLPADVARELGCGTLIASRVSLAKDEEFVYDRVPSLAEVLRAKLTRRAIRYPHMMTVLVRGSMLASIHRENAAARDADLLFVPPLEQFGLMEFSAIHAIVASAREYAAANIAEWQRTGRLANLLHLQAR